MSVFWMESGDSRQSIWSKINFAAYLGKNIFHSLHLRHEKLETDLNLDTFISSGDLMFFVNQTIQLHSLTASRQQFTKSLLIIITIIID